MGWAGYTRSGGRGRVTGNGLDPAAVSRLGSAAWSGSSWEREEGCAGDRGIDGRYGAAKRNGLRIHEVPVDWVEDLDSRVEIVSTVLSDLAGLWRVRRSFWRGGGRLQPTGESVAVAR